LPHAFDEYDTTGIAFDLDRPLSPFQTRLLLSALPAGTRIVGAAFTRREWLPSPVRVSLLLPAGSERTVYVRMERYVGGVETEARLLPVLQRLGLPAPTLLAGPKVDPDLPGVSACSVVGAVPGEPLADRGWAGAPGDMVVTGLGIEGVLRLHHATQAVLATAVALPRKTLASDLAGVAARGGPWCDDPYFAESLRALLPVAAAVRTPLVFSNGDYNPGNFLASGDRLTGIIDFARACLEDPLIGFAKYEIYNFAPWLQAGFIERCLAALGFGKSDFALRLAVRCLFTLQREMPQGMRRGRQGQIRYRERLYGLIGAARAMWE